jgi:hypothetical protein
MPQIPIKRRTADYARVICIDADIVESSVGGNEAKMQATELPAMSEAPHIQYS